MSEYTLNNLNGAKVWQTAVSSKLAIDDGIKKVLCEYSKAKISKIEILEGMVSAHVRFITKLLYINSSGDTRSKTFEIELESSSECAMATLDSRYICSQVKVLDEEFNLSGETDARADAVLEISMYLTSTEKVSSCTDKDEGTFLKTEEYSVSTLTGSGEYRTEISSDIKVKDDVKEVLLCDTRGIVKNIDNKKGLLVISGEVYTRVCYLTNDELPLFKTVYSVSDFNEEITTSPEDIFDAGFANCEVMSSSASGGDREMSVRAELRLNYAVFERTNISLTTDAYNTKNKLKLNYGSRLTSKLSETLSFKDEVTASVKLPVSEDNKLKINSILEKDILIANNYIKDGEFVVEGLAGFTVFYDEISFELDTKILKSVDTTVPFSFKFKTQVEEYDKLICEINFKNGEAKLSRDEAEISSDVEIVVTVIANEVIAYLEGTSMQSETYEEPASISLYIAEASDNLWSISKKLRMDPEVLLIQNKELENEVYNGQQVVVYRQR